MSKVTMVSKVFGDAVTAAVRARDAQLTEDVNDQLSATAAAVEAAFKSVGIDLAKLTSPAIEKVTVDYTNYRGERALRTITPWGVEYGSTDWHPELGWLLTCYDHDKHACRVYAVSGIHSWNGQPVTAITHPPATGCGEVVEARIDIPRLTDDQRDYLAKVQVAASDYDPSTMVRGHNPIAALDRQTGESEGWRPGDLAMNVRYKKDGIYPALGETAFVQRTKTSSGHLYLEFGPDDGHAYLASLFDKATLPAAPRDADWAAGQGEAYDLGEALENAGHSALAGAHGVRRRP